MLKREESICPCCGKPLVLMGKVLGDKYHEFYLTLPLTFEGKPAGTAEVTEIYENKDRGL